MTKHTNKNTLLLLIEFMKQATKTELVGYIVLAIAKMEQFLDDD